MVVSFGDEAASIFFQYTRHSFIPRLQCGFSAEEFSLRNSTNSSLLTVLCFLRVLSVHVKVIDQWDH